MSYLTLYIVYSLYPIKCGSVDLCTVPIIILPYFKLSLLKNVNLSCIAQNHL